LGGLGQRRVLLDEARQQGVDRNPLPPSLGGKPRFGLSSNLDAHKAQSPFVICITARCRRERKRSDRSHRSRLVVRVMNKFKQRARQGGDNRRRAGRGLSAGDRQAAPRSTRSARSARTVRHANRTMMPVEDWRGAGGAIRHNVIKSSWSISDDAESPGPAAVNGPLVDLLGSHLQHSHQWRLLHAALPE
jgi:hypothetical protein